MKKLFFIGCFVFLWSHSFPQRNELFQIWKTAAEDVNKYDYRPKYEVLDPDSYHFHTYDLQETLHTTYSRLTDSDYKKLARSLIKKGGFDFDRQNDTLMFLFNFYLSVNVPGVVIAKSSCSEKVYFVREPGIVFRSYPVTKEFNDGNIAFKAQYEGDVAKFRELFLKYGYWQGSRFTYCSEKWEGCVAVLSLDLSSHKKGTAGSIKSLICILPATLFIGLPVFYMLGFGL